MYPILNVTGTWLLPEDSAHLEVPFGACCSLSLPPPVHQVHLESAHWPYLPLTLPVTAVYQFSGHSAPFSITSFSLTQIWPYYEHLKSLWNQNMDRSFMLSTLPTYSQDQTLKLVTIDNYVKKKKKNFNIPFSEHCQIAFLQWTPSILSWDSPKPTHLRYLSIKTQHIFSITVEMIVIKSKYHYENTIFYCSSW